MRSLLITPRCVPEFAATRATPSGKGDVLSQSKESAAGE